MGIAQTRSDNSRHMAHDSTRKRSKNQFPEEEVDEAFFRTLQEASCSHTLVVLDLNHLANKWCRNPGTRLESGERRSERQDQPGGEDAPGPTRRMEALVKVVSQLHKQWGIDCKPEDFTLAVTRLLQIGVIAQPVDILHPEVWDKCSKALCEETMSLGPEEARGAAGKSESEDDWARPPPYVPQNGAKWQGEGQGGNAPGGNREEALELTSAHKREWEENGKEKGGGGDREGEGSANTSWDEWLATDPNSEEEEMGVDRVKSQKIPIRNKEGPRGGKIPLTDWRKIKIACADWAPSATLAIPVRVTDGGQRVYSPVSPKDVQAIVKAIADKGLNSAMASTLIDGVFGGDDMLPFNIKQTCRLILDGAGMIVFKQEWEDNCARQLAQVTGADHPLHCSSLQRLMGTDPTMIAPQAQAQGLRAHEVMTTTCATREAIRTASRVIAKPSPWSTRKQNESESFTQFVDRLQAAVDSSTLPAEAKGPVVADCLRQQCKSKTKEILRSLPVGSSIANMIKHVTNEEHLAPIQVAVRTTIANVMACFKRGHAGHVVANWPRLGDPSTVLPPRQNRSRGPCWACGKKGHFAKECRTKTQGNGCGRGHLGRARPSPTWDMRRPNYANPGWGEALPNSLHPREATNFMVQPTVQPNLPLSQGQQGPPLGGETPGWPWQ
ncbi:uncharacterized protein ACIB01_018648 [Guaruba guarouba]